MEPKLSILIEQAPIGIITFSSEGVIDYLNQNFEKFGILYQFETAELIGKNIFEIPLFPPVTLAHELTDLSRGMSFEKELKQIRTNDGGQITLIVKGTPLYEENEYAGGILLVEDIKVLAETTEILKSRADYIEKVISRVNDFLIVTDSSGDVQFSAGHTLNKFKLIQSDIEGKNIIQLFNASVKLKISESIENILHLKAPQKFNFELIALDQKYFFECKVEPLFGKRDTIQFIYFFFNDRTAELNERSNLQKNISDLSLYKSAANQSSMGLITINKDGVINTLDDESEKIFGVSKEQVEGKHINKIIEAMSSFYINELALKLHSASSVKVNVKILGDGDKKIIELKFSLTNQNDDYLIILCKDITEAFEAEENLKLTEDTLQEIVDNADELICKTDVRGNVIYANQQFISRFEYSPEELKSTNIFNLISTKVSDEQLALISKFPNQAVHHAELNFTTKNGKILTVNASLIPVTSKNHEKYFYCYLTDISEIKTYKQDFQVFKSSFDFAQDGIAVEHEGKIIIVNEAFAKIFGYDNVEQLEKKELLDLVANEDVLKVAEYLRLRERKKHAPDRFEFLGKKRDNSLFYTEFSVSTFESNGNVYIIMITRDITERKRAQIAIRESEEKYRNITENIDDFLYTFEKVDKYLRPVFYTSAVEKVTGYTQTDFLSDSKLFLKIIHPDDLHELKKKITTFLKSKFQNSIEFEFRIINKHGNIVWVRNKVNIMRKSDGGIYKIYGLVNDITLKKRAEEELKQSAESLKKINETKDRFISIVSHDLRTPFSSILGFTDLLTNDEGLSEDEKRQYIKYIQESSRSMLSLVNSLLDWTRLQTGRFKFEPQKISAREIIESSFNVLSGAALQKGIDIKIDVEKEHFIFVDKSLIMQVFNNLLSNAIKFTGKGDLISVSVHRTSVPRFLEFSVQDTGRGIKPENIEKLFNVDTKFTLEGTAGEKGSGLGLSLVKEIVEKHGGKVWVKSEFGKGSDFRLTLPVASANILIVDDNKMDRILYSKILKNITPEYSVEIVSNGREALERIKTSPPALVITEHNMPEMNGYEFINAVMKDESIHSLPILILSRKVDRASIQAYSELGIEFVFQKPVNLANFKLAVEKSLKKGIKGNGAKPI